MKMTYERASKVLFYCAESGGLFWRVTLSSRGPRGEPAGFIMQNGYIGVGVDGTGYYAHRIAWLLYYGHWPTDQIDHINGDKKDNKISNLREATNGLNAANRGLRIDNKSGVTGVIFDKHRGLWRVQVGRKFIGRFPSKMAAIAAREAAGKISFGDFFHN